MKHNILAKYNDSVTDKDKFADEVESLFGRLCGSIDGIHSVSVLRNCIDRPNRYDIMIVIDMDRTALDAYDDSEVHHFWKNHYSGYLEKKAIFDYEDQNLEAL